MCGEKVTIALRIEDRGGEGIGMAWKGNGLRRGLGVLIGAATMALALYRLLPGETGLPEREFCTAVALALALVIAALAGRPGFGLLASGALVGAIWLAGALKLAYLHTPLLAPDLRYFASTSTLDVIAHYPKIWRKCTLVLVGVAILGFLVWRLESPGWWRRRSWLAHAAAVAVAALPMSLVTWPEGPFRQVHATTLWEFMSQAERNPVTTFLRSITRMRVQLPSYTPDAADAFDWGAESVPANPPAHRPDLFVVLEESTLDPRQWSICDVPRCVLPMFDADDRTHARGLLRVHTYGGGTWTSEFAFLTGLPHTLFGAAGLYAPFNLAPRVQDSLPRHLRALGYRTVGIYSMPRSFLRAAEAYAEYGFDRLVDAQDLGLVWTSTDEELMRGVERVLAEERAGDDRPLFFMILTMRQHGPHDYPLDTLPSPWNLPPLPGQDERLNRNLGHYLYRLHQSSEAIAGLRRLLFDSARPSVLVHFGDHHPTFDGLESALETTLPSDLRTEASQLTYYRIDSSVDGMRFEPAAPLDIAFLGGLLLDVAGLPKGAYFEANTRLRERCRGRFDDCPDRAVLDSYLAYAFDVLNVFAK